MLANPTGAPVVIETAMVFTRVVEILFAVGVAGAVTMCVDRCGWSAWLHQSITASLPEEPQSLTEDR